MTQKLKKDAGKLRYDLIPPEALTALAEIYTFGLSKGYGEESWREVSIKRYIGAFLRHWVAYLMNHKGKDQESGHCHIKHVLWNAVTLCMKTCYMEEESRELTEGVILKRKSEPLPVQKGCWNCKHKSLTGNREPCNNCGKNSHWEA